MRPILYSFRRCPFAMRARMALDVAEIVVDHREVKLSDKPPAMLAASPKGTVPVLVLEDGTVLEESLDIMDWALDQSDLEGWKQDGARSRAEAFLVTFKDALDRYKYASRYNPEAKRGDVDESQRAIALSALEDLTNPLKNQSFLHSADQAGYLDVATFPFVRQFANTEPDWWRVAAPESVRTWLDKLVSSSRFQRVMHKHDPWRDPSVAEAKR